MQPVHVKLKKKDKQRNLTAENWVFAQSTLHTCDRMVLVAGGSKCQASSNRLSDFGDVWCLSLHSPNTLAFASYMILSLRSIH